MSPAPQIRFLRFGGRSVAFAVSGTGPVLVAPAPWTSHVERDWDDPAFRSFWESLADGHTLVRYDRLGVGMSDRDIGEDDLSLDGDVALLAAVIDALDVATVTLIGGSAGSCAAIAYAARFPDRVDRLLLYGAYADGPAITSPAVREAIVGTVRSHWGLGSRMLADIFLGDAGSAEHDRLARSQREAASPDTAAVLLELLHSGDVRAELGAVTAPTLVVHRREDRAIPFRLGREVATGIPSAQLIPLPGNAHFPWVGDASSVVRALRSALAPEAPTRAVTAQPATTLSAREREVLALVAAGMSDQEIAEHLIVSPHTVHRHVANIRTKLGRTTRSAAVAEAARLGLI